MATSTRLEIITKTKERIGRKAQGILLVNAYDAITQLMTTKYPLIPHQRTAGSMVGAQNYVTSPASIVIRRPEKMMVGSTLAEIEWKEPELFVAYKGATNASPTLWTYMRDQTTPYAVLQPYFYPAPDSTYGYAFYYSVINGKSSGDSYTHSMTEYFDESIILGCMWKGAEIMGEFSRALAFRQLFFKDLAERALTFTKEFKTVE